MQKENRTVWTIGHSTRSLEVFIHMLQSFQIEMVADIRSFPGSRKFPQFNKEILQVSLAQNNIHYVHLMQLGGRRKINPNSKNISWRNVAFRGYADYMETDSFKEGVQELEKIALKQPTAYMCSEAVWWRCHRSMLSDYLKVRGWKILHIMGMGKEAEHAFTAPARVVDDKLSYESTGKEKGLKELSV